MSNEVAVKSPEQVENVVRHSPERIYRPAVNIIEQDGAIVLQAALPGVSAANLSVTVEMGRLSIEGAIDSSAPEGFTSVYSELPVGRFQRSFKISDVVDVENITAELKNGLLTLTLPRVQAALPRRIEIAPA